MTGEHDTITLKDAAEHFGFTVSTLRAEADRGRLTLYKIGKRYYTTPADIKSMVEQCRVEPKARAFTLIKTEDSTRLETARASSERAQQSLERLKSISRNTSGTSTSQSRRARH